MADIQDTIADLKGKIPDITPTPPGFHSKATAHELKSRLNWGEPALTIIDVRDHDAFNAYRILGAMSMSMDRLVGLAQATISPKRDIYVYGETDEQTAQAAQMLRDVGFMHVAELQGGVKAFREIGGSIEGNQTPLEPPSPGAYNVGARLSEFAKEKQKEGHTI